MFWRIIVTVRAWHQCVTFAKLPRGAPQLFAKGKRSDKYLDEMGRIGIAIRGAEYPLFSVSQFPLRAGGFEKLFLRQEREHSREPFHVAEIVAGNGRFLRIFSALSPGSEQSLLTTSFCDRLIKCWNDWYNPPVLLLLATFPIVPHGFGILP